ncbi:MAG TPA: hypothetical protein VI542_03560 [Candidatus Tectomicrobia bacterium]
MQELAQDLSALPLNKLFGLTVCQRSSGGREQLLNKVFELHAGLVELIWYGECCDVHAWVLRGMVNGFLHHQSTPDRPTSETPICCNSLSSLHSLIV